MNAIGIAALIAAVSFAVLTLTGVVVAFKLNRLFGATTQLIRDAGAEHDTVLARVNAAIDRTNSQLDRTEAVTVGMDKLGDGVNELAGQVNALTEFGKTLAGSIVGGPVGRAAAMAYGVRHAIGLRTGSRRTLSGEVIRPAAARTPLSPDAALSPDATVSSKAHVRPELTRGQKPRGVRRKKGAMR
jgi:uncharacterized protein YoxC